jgi:hypothetical protein
VKFSNGKESILAYNANVNLVRVVNLPPAFFERIAASAVTTVTVDGVFSVRLDLKRPAEVVKALRDCGWRYESLYNG